MEDSDNTTLATKCSSISITQQTILFAVFLSIALIGIFGNTFSIALLSQRKRGREKILSDVYRVYVIALAIADNGMLFFTGILRYCIVAWLYVPEASGFFYEIYLCRWHRFSMHTFHNASAWLLVVMAFDRFLAVSFPFTYREINLNAKNAKRVTIAVYTVSVAMATPFLAVGPVFKTEENHYNTTNSSSSIINSTEVFNSLRYTNITLDLENKSKIVYIEGCSLVSSLSNKSAFVINLIFHIGLAFWVPYVVLLFLNIAIFRNLHCRKKSTNTFSNRLGRRITIMMLVIGCVFVVLWLPQEILLMEHVDAHSHASKKDEFVASVAALIGLSNSALNFFLYCMTVKKFRAAAWKSISSKLCFNINSDRLCCFKKNLNAGASNPNIALRSPQLRIYKKGKCKPTNKNDIIQAEKF